MGFSLIPTQAVVYKDKPALGINLAINYRLNDLSVTRLQTGISVSVVTLSQRFIPSLFFIFTVAKTCRDLTLESIALL